MNDLKSLSSIATSLLQFYSGAFSLRDYPPMKDIYDSAFHKEPKKILMKAGRQISKSVTESALLILGSLLRPGMRSLYVSNLSIQTTRFSKSYLAEFLKSPIFEEYNPIEVDNVHTKSFANSSNIELSYLYENANRIRGIPSDFNVYDEIQDINYDDIPIVRECLSASVFGFEAFAGTPKTLDNTIEALWQQSKKLEWAMKCRHCETWNIPDEENAPKMIQKNGPSCIKCGKRLPIRDGSWIEIEQGSDTNLYGFHLPQHIFPMHSEKYDHKTGRYIPGSFDGDLTAKWRELYAKKLRYPKIKFHNEVLGLSQDEGGRVITLTELKKCAQLPETKNIDMTKYDDLRIAGIDWGISAETSFTTIVILTHSNDVAHVVFMEKFNTTDILQIIDEIIQICGRYKVELIAADRGVGFTNNQLLMKNFSAKVVEFQYGAWKKLLQYDPKSKCHNLDKTTSLDITFMNMKARKILFPPYEESEEIFLHILAEYEEFMETPGKRQKVFRRSPSSPDDYLHALNFASFAMNCRLGVSLLNMDSLNPDGEIILA